YRRGIHDLLALFLRLHDGRVARRLRRAVLLGRQAVGRFRVSAPRAAVRAELRGLVYDVAAGRADALRRGRRGRPRRGERIKHLDHVLRALKGGLAPQAQAEMLVAVQPQDQAAGLFRAERLDVGKGQPFDFGEREEVRQYLAGPAVFGMDVLEDE